MGTRAFQLLPSFQGDHQSAKMYSLASDGVAGVSRMMFDGATMTVSSAVVTTSAPFFLASDVGLHVTVQGAGASGATLVATVLTFTDSTHVTLSVSASTHAVNQIIFIGLDETSVITNTLLPPGSDGSGLSRLIPLGNYLIASGTILIPNPQSGSLTGQGPRFASVIVNRTATSSAPVLQLGNGTFEPHSYVLEKLSIDGNAAPAQGVLYFSRCNLMAIRDVSVQGVGPGAIGILNPAADPLFGEMVFDHVEVLGIDGTIQPSVAIQIYATENIDFHSCNIEQVYTGLIFQGASQVKLLWSGGHIERIGDYAMWLANCIADITCDISVGQVWLGNDVVNSSLNLTNTSGLWASGAVVDNGFGNRIRKPAAYPLEPGNLRAYSSSVTTDGDEWLKVPNINPDPTFLLGVSAWSTSGSSVAASTISFPGIKRGASMIITDSGGGNGNATATFTAAANTDYLLQVGILTKGTDSYRIVVSNSTTTVYDSGNFSHPTFGEQGDQQSYTVYRKSIPVTSDTVFKVTIYAVGAGQITIVPLLLISQSSIRMSVNFATNGTGFSSSGSGPNLAYTQATATGSFYTVSGNSTKKCFLRCVASIPANVGGSVGVGGTVEGSGPQLAFRSGVTAEYILPLSCVPPLSVNTFYSFINFGSITISEIGIYEMVDTDEAPYVLTQPYPLLPNTLPLTTGLIPLGNVNAPSVSPIIPGSYWQTQPSSANHFIRGVLASNIFWDEGAGMWNVGVNGSTDWHAFCLLNGGALGFACQTGLTLPTTITNAQFESMIQFIIPSDDRFGTHADACFAFFNPGNTEQFLLTFGSGSPQGVVNASIGCVYIDITNGVFWFSFAGGMSNWRPLSTIFTTTEPGLVPVSPGGTTTFLRADGNWATTSPGSGSVTLAMMANLAANTIIGNNTGSPATPLALSPSSVAAMLFTAWVNYSGSISVTGLGSTVINVARWQVLGTTAMVRIEVTGTPTVNGQAPTFSLPTASMDTGNAFYGTSVLTLSGLQSGITPLQTSTTIINCGLGSYSTSLNQRYIISGTFELP